MTDVEDRKPQVPETTNEHAPPDMVDPEAGILAPKDESLGLSDQIAYRVLGNLSWLDRLLPLWIVLAMVIGCVIGVYAANGVHNAFDKGSLNGVPAPIVVGLLVMMWPPFCKTQWEIFPKMVRSSRVWRNVLVSLVLNWILGPFVMLACAWATLPDLPDYRTGVIMIGVARCIAMVMIWNQIAGGDHDLCAFIVVINSVLQIILYAPLVLLFVNVISGTNELQLNYPLVSQSVGIYLGIPLAAGALFRAVFLLSGRSANFAKRKEFYNKRVLPFVSPLALLGLLYTIVVIFAEQGELIVHNLGPVFRTIAPLVLYFMVMWVSAFLLVRQYETWFYNRFRSNESLRSSSSPEYCAVIPQTFTAASNNFELSIAIATATFGVNSKQALAATIGPLVEVPVLVTLAYLALFLKGRLHWRDVKARVTKEHSDKSAEYDQEAEKKGVIRQSTSGEDQNESR